MREQRLQKLGLSYIDPQAKIIGQAAQQNGLRAHLVGGTVRDALLNRPSSDMDICVAGDPAKMVQIGDFIYSSLSQKLRNSYEVTIRQAEIGQDLKTFLQQSGGGVQLAFLLYLSGQTDFAPVIYPRFLVAMVNINGEKYEFVATRTEDYSTTEGEGSRSRNPGSVAVTDEYGDAVRRDFTMNALYVNLATGELLDPTQKGVADIRDKIIRITRFNSENPEETFLEDPLRIVRGVRQSVQLGFNIDPQTDKLMRELIVSGGPEFFVGKGARVASERMRDELIKLLKDKRTVQGIQSLLDYGILDLIMPEVAAVARDQHIDYKNIWEHTLKVIQNISITPEIDQAIRNTAEKVGMPYDALKEQSLIRLKLDGLLHDIGKISTKQLGTILCSDCKKSSNVSDSYSARQCPYCGKIFNFQQDMYKKTTFDKHEYASEKMAKDILRRLDFPNNMVRWVARDCALHQVQFDNYLSDEINIVNQGVTQPSRKTLVEKLAVDLADRRPEAPDVWDELNFAIRMYGLIRADATVNPQAQQKRVNEFIRQYEAAMANRQQEDLLLEFNRPILSGQEIMEMFNVRPGIWIGNIHSRLRQDKLENPDNHTRERAIQLAQEELDKWGPEIYKQ